MFAVAQGSSNALYNYPTGLLSMMVFPFQDDDEDDGNGSVDSVSPSSPEGNGSNSNQASAPNSMNNSVSGSEAGGPGSVPATPTNVSSPAHVPIEEESSDYQTVMRSCNLRSRPVSRFYLFLFLISDFSKRERKSPTCTALAASRV